MSRTLYVTDMDGTLLGPDSQVSDRSRSIISDLSSRGALITVATARTPATVQPLLAGMHTVLPAITMTGAALWRRNPPGFEHLHLMAAADVATCLRLCAACSIHPFVYTLGPGGDDLRVYHAGDGLNRAEQKFYDERRHLRLKHFHLRCPLPEEALDRTILLCTLGPLAHINEAAGALSRHTECVVQSYPDILMADTAILEVFAPGVSKAAAVEDMRRAEGADRVVVFGDNLNDLPMMEVADVAVAVANALPEVREAADVVIGRNADDAVARFILDDFMAS